MHPAVEFGSIPVVHGVLLTGEDARAAVVGDFGHMVYREPGAVVRPGSVDDVVATVRWAAQHGLPIAARGSGHSLNGQAQVQDGVIVDMRSLGAVHRVERDRVVVDAGAQWSSVLAATVQRGLTPPVFTDYLETTVGGTLSFGGIGGMSHHYGAQTDNVLELDVVTGDGQLVTCSPSENRELFDAVRAGVGQYGLIVRATLGLIAAREWTRCYRVGYDDVHAFTADQQSLIAERRFDYLEGFASVDENDGVRYVLEVATFVPSLDAVDDTALLRDLHYLPGAEEIVDVSYPDFLNRLAPDVALRREIGDWEWPHPWLNVFLPASAAEGFISDVMAELSSADFANGGIVLTYPMLTAALTTPLLRLPDEEVTVLFALLFATAPDEAGSVDRLGVRNRRLYERALAVGGTLYPIGLPTLTPTEWQAHFGSMWPEVGAAAARYDPHRILTPGPGLKGG